MYGLTEDDLDIQERARAFADELIPYEEQAELSGRRAARRSGRRRTPCGPAS